MPHDTTLSERVDAGATGPLDADALLDAHDAEVQAALTWLAQEFPGWAFDVDRTDTYTRRDQQRWIARRDGHHPQAALSAAKLHTRLDEYLQRLERKRRAIRAN